MKIYIKTILVLLAGLSLKLDAQDNKAAADTNNYLSVELGEIVIKASKDNVTFRNIPASVSVVSENAISDNEIKSLNDASAAIPNFFMPDYGSKLTSPVYIRGIGSRINEYLNSYNTTILTSTLRKISQVILLNKKLFIYWYHEDDDDDILDKGEYISSVLNIPFEFIRVDNIRAC